MSPRPAHEFSHCIVCGHTDAAVVADAADVRREVEWLWAYQSRRLEPDTPASRLVDRVVFSQDPPFRLVRCLECGLVYRNPVERERELRAMYGDEGPTREALVALHERQRADYRRQARRLRAVLGRGGSVLEVGSYVGAFLDAARDEGLAAEGVDINERTNEFTRSLGFTVHDGELCDTPSDRAFDAIVVWNTLDQLADPRGTIMSAVGRLTPSGVFAARVPNGQFYMAWRGRLGARNSARHAFAQAILAQNNLLAFPYRWGFSIASLTRLFREAGLVEERAFGDVLVSVGDEWTRRWARVEERVAKTALRLAVRWAPERAPWIEVYARRPPAGIDGARPA